MSRSEILFKQKISLHEGVCALIKEEAYGSLRLLYHITLKSVWMQGLRGRHLSQVARFLYRELLCPMFFLKGGGGCRA
jgi:hypothetical protein